MVAAFRDGCASLIKSHTLFRCGFVKLHWGSVLNCLEEII